MSEQISVLVWGREGCQSCQQFSDDLHARTGLAAPHRNIESSSALDALTASADQSILGPVVEVRQQTITYMSLDEARKNFKLPAGGGKEQPDACATPPTEAGDNQEDVPPLPGGVRQ